MKASDPVFEAALEQVLTPVVSLPGVEGVVSVLNAPEQARAHFLSADGNTALVLVRLGGGEKAAVKAYPAVRHAIVFPLAVEVADEDRKEKPPVRRK